MNDFTVFIRQSIRKLLGYFFKFVPQINRELKNGLTVFVFHDVTDTPSRFSKEYGISVSVDAFNHQVKWIKKNFNVMHPSNLINGSKIKENSAIISFDDGFEGSFNNGLRILKQMDLPSVFFLNMKAVLEGTPILSATACYLSKYSPDFISFANKIGLSQPFHLTLTPAILEKYETEYGVIDKNSVLAYQGQFASFDTVKKWENNNCVVYGNHLYEHWNAYALSENELIEQYKKNEDALMQLKNKINLFAFTNGQPNTCYTERDVNILRQLGAKKIFSTLARINNDSSKCLLGRFSLGERDSNENYLRYRLGVSVLKDFLNRK